MIANNLRTGEFDEEEDRFKWERERGGQEWGSVTDQCPRYRAIGCWKEDLCDRMERLDPQRVLWTEWKLM